MRKAFDGFMILIGIVASLAFVIPFVSSIEERNVQAEEKARMSTMNPEELAAYDTKREQESIETAERLREREHLKYCDAHPWDCSSRY